ncbi:MAG TPA: hypothetical protein VF943_06415 [Burkholderiales bacterium]
MANKRTGSVSSFFLGEFFAFVVAIVSGCSTVTLISDYDPDTDKQLTALYQSTDAFISKLKVEISKWDKERKSPQNSYDTHKKFYADFDEKLRFLEFRVQSIPKNTKTQKLVADIRTAVLLRDEQEKQCEEGGLVIKVDEETSLASLQSIHCLRENKANGPSRKSLEISQRNINQIIGAALALEIGKKQGSESNK